MELGTGSGSDVVSGAPFTERGAASIGVIETMQRICAEDKDRGHRRMLPLFRDAASRAGRTSAMGHLFRAGTEYDSSTEDPVLKTIAEMDRHGIERTMIEISDEGVEAQRALREHPQRFFAEYECNANLGMEELRKIERMKRDWDIKAVSCFPAGVFPPVAFGDKKMYPIFAKCVEIDVPICVPLGVPGPRIPMAPQDVEQVDEICWFFPELRVVMRHGCEPWVDLAVKLMLKYPGLYYSTSAYAPRYYPRAVIDYANTRGCDRLIFSGYLPLGSDYDRVFRELATIGLADQVWRPFLRDNAIRVFGL